MKNVSTIYKRELKQLFGSLSGWLFIALNLAALGICAVWLCLRNGNPSFQYVPETASLILCFTVPLMQAMTVGAEWKRGETAMTLRYASAPAVTVGKYLAEATVFAVPAVICLILPLVFMGYGITSLVGAFISAITYVLVGMALIALGLFIASLIKHTVISGAVSVGVCLLLNVASNVAKVVTADQTLPFVLSAVALTAVTVVIMCVYLNNAVIPAVFAAISSALTLILALTGNAPTVFRVMLKLVSPQYAFYENIYGTASLQGFVQPILFIAVFLGFTALTHANYNKTLTVELNKNGKVGE